LFVKFRREAVGIEPWGDVPAGARERLRTLGRVGARPFENAQARVRLRPRARTHPRSLLRSRVRSDFRRCRSSVARRAGLGSCRDEPFGWVEGVNCGGDAGRGRVGGSKPGSSRIRCSQVVMHPSWFVRRNKDVIAAPSHRDRVVARAWTWIGPLMGLWAGFGAFLPTSTSRTSPMVCSRPIVSGSGRWSWIW
jgi:hypothetical protein